MNGIKSIDSKIWVCSEAFTDLRWELMFLLQSVILPYRSFSLLCFENHMQHCHNCSKDTLNHAIKWICKQRKGLFPSVLFVKWRVLIGEIILFSCMFQLCSVSYFEYTWPFLRNFIWITKMYKNYYLSNNISFRFYFILFSVWLN